ncbi:MAG: hypothetical protein JWN61_2756, partial [Pseudonocardiales bacterium]|nr:hypothetical protein [Pseudonocardiales bacterium]
SIAQEPTAATVADWVRAMRAELLGG